MMNMECNLLFTSAGRRVGLIRLFRQALQGLGMSGHIFTVDVTERVPAYQAGDAWDVVPHPTEPGYVERLWEMCKRFKIGMLVPLNDAELCLLAEYRDLFAKLGTTVLVSSPEVNRLCVDSRETGRFFRGIGVRTPEVCEPAAVISGDEYAIDVLVDFAGKVRSVVPRLRMDVKAGEAGMGMTVKDARLMAAAQQVVERLPGARGCLTLHGFVTKEGEVWLTEIRPCFGGGFLLAAAAGADFPKWLLQIWRGEDVDVAPDGWEDGVTMLGDDEELFERKETGM